MTETSTKIRARLPAYFNMDYQDCDYADVDDLKEMLRDSERVQAVVKEHNLSEARVWGDAEFEDQDGITRFNNCELVVSQYGVYYSDMPKHGDGFAETRTIDVPMLRQIVEYCEANNLTEIDLSGGPDHQFREYSEWLRNPVTKILNGDEEDEDEDIDLDDAGQPAPSM